MKGLKGLLRKQVEALLQVQEREAVAQGQGGAPLPPLGGESEGEAALPGEGEAGKGEGIAD